MVDFIKKLFDTPDHTGEFSEEEIKAAKVISIHAYFGVVFFLPLCFKKGNKYGRFNANQGLILFICEAIVSAVSSALSKIPVFGTINSIVCYLIQLVLLAFAIVSIVNVAKGKAKEIPLFGKFKLIKY